MPKISPTLALNPNARAIAMGGTTMFSTFASFGRNEETTLVSFYRTVYSPLGAGHTALVLSDRDADGWDEGDLRAIYTDNEALTGWARENVVRLPGHPLRDYSLPIRAARFEASGAVGLERREVIRAAEHEIALTWADFEPL